MSVLVTRPGEENTELAELVEAAGGTAVRYPAIDIVARASLDVQRQIDAMPEPGIAIFISRNAVRYGLAAVSACRARLAAIGPSTRAAIEREGHAVDISPAHGFDSESLLQHDELQRLTGTTVLIVRGNRGRALLADSLAARGAAVYELAVYERRAAQPSAARQQALQQHWTNEGVDVIIAMSVESLDCLLQILPPPCRQRLGSSVLVTPSNRVLQTALERVPEMQSALADGPRANELIAAIIGLRDTF
jgi:uroporphyrinogen-III synthase